MNAMVGAASVSIEPFEFNRPGKMEPRNAGLEVVAERFWTMSSHWTKDTYSASCVIT